MKKSSFLTLFFILLSLTPFYGQKITDGATLDVSGLAITFNILNKEAISVGGKSFDRYKVSATLVNKSGKNYNVRLSNAPQVVSDIKIAELDCINATGAKLTSKRLELKLKPQNVNVTYWAYTKDGKYQSFIIPIVAGYYLDEGDSVNDNAIFIVPSGEIPEVNIRKTM
ncbi:hypothetical protein [Chryseobacterium arthrosphaerae]|uniref:hypothetical protein n=1 Tax=Chryseobacterium arthrosphaerae TaxID=651561 RepID=UPI0031D6C369